MPSRPGTKMPARIIFFQLIVRDKPQNSGTPVAHMLLLSRIRILLKPYFFLFKIF